MSADYSCTPGDVVFLSCLTAGGSVEAAATDSDMATSISALESLLDYTFRNPRLAEEALTHRSTQRRVSYQRLEFLGDAAVGLAVATHLFLTNRGEGPGGLTLLRAANVSTEKLARAALRHGLYDHLHRRAPDLDSLVADFAAAVAREEDEDAKLSDHGGASVKAPKVLADVTESVFAAVFVDTGYNLAEMWRVCRGLLEPLVTAETVHDQPVSVLYMVCQQRRWDLHFNFGREADRTVCNAFINGQLRGVGSCRSDQKKLAKVNAARDALREISRFIGGEAEAAAQEKEEEMGMGVGIRGEGVVRSEDIGVDSRDAVGRVEVEKSQYTDEEAGVICGLNCIAVAGGGWPEEEVEGAKTKLQSICGKNHWSNPVYRIEKELGPAHDRRFICSVHVETPRGAYVMSGGMKSKRKDAENASASELIRGLLNGHATKVNS